MADVSVKFRHLRTLVEVARQDHMLVLVNDVHAPGDRLRHFFPAIERRHAIVQEVLADTVDSFRDPDVRLVPVSQVSAKLGEVEGLPVYKSLAETPGPADVVSVYLRPAVTMSLLPELEAYAPKQVFLNPGADAMEVVMAAREHGLNPVRCCSIIELGYTPSQFPA